MYRYGYVCRHLAAKLPRAWLMDRWQRHTSRGRMLRASWCSRATPPRWLTYGVVRGGAAHVIIVAGSWLDVTAFVGFGGVGLVFAIGPTELLLFLVILAGFVLLIVLVTRARGK